MKNCIACVWMTMNSIGENMKNNNLSILGAGFACLDIIKTKNQEEVMLGGTAANVVTILSLLGLKTSFLTARYSGQTGRYMERAFESRGVECIFFTDTKSQAPKIIEGIEEGKHFFITVCPKCGRLLTKCSLPSLSQMNKVKRQYNFSPNIFFFDRISEGIKEFARENQNGWNVYEPNSCRIYSNLIRGIQVANIVKYSEDRISSKITDSILKDIKNTDVALLIVTMGKKGIKYVYRTETGELSDWSYIVAEAIEKVEDSSGSGDWLTAVFLYFLLKKYPNYTNRLNGQYLYNSLVEAQKYATQNCFFIGAQGMLRNRSVVDRINLELDGEIKSICDGGINWEYDCCWCYNEYIE